MNERLYENLCEDIAAQRPALVKDIIRLVNIKSVQSEPAPGAPFGEGCRKVLDTVLEMGKEAGFIPRMYDDMFVSLAMKEGPIDLGIWCHGDVVPEGDGWLHPPYEATEYKDCIIGRGATDNKGQLAAIFRLMQILKGRNVEFPFNIALFVGSNEENGMRDIQAYVKKYPQPKLNLVPDGGFPVAYCGTGGMRLWLTSNTPVEGLTLDGGHADAPGLARAVFDDGRVFTEEEAPGHSAKTKTDNVFAKLLLRLPKVKEQDVLDYLIAVATAEDGKVLGITHEDEDLGATIVRPTKLRTVDGKPGIYVRLRYPYGLTEQDVIAAVTETAAEHGFTAGDFMSTVPPFKYSLEDPYLKLLWETSEEVIGNGKAPFREMGGTYAHHLHNGFIYGMNGNLRPEDYPEGRGSAHSRDELVSISRLQRAMRIYARLLLKLSETGI